MLNGSREARDADNYEGLQNRQRRRTAQNLYERQMPINLYYRHLWLLTRKGPVRPIRHLWGKFVRYVGVVSWFFFLVTMHWFIRSGTYSRHHVISRDIYLRLNVDLAFQCHVYVLTRLDERQYYRQNYATVFISSKVIFEKKFLSKMTILTLLDLSTNIGLIHWSQVHSKGILATEIVKLKKY